MKLKSIASLVLIFLCVGTLHAQGTRRHPAPRPSEPLTTQTATTKDGRTVVLKSDGTWEYAKETDEALATKPTGGRKNATLSFEAGLVFKSGDVKPVARTDFFLLDEDLGKILKDAGLQPPRTFTTDRPLEEQLVDAFASSIVFSILDEYKAFYPAATAALQPHIVQNVTTDFTGKASFQPAVAGTYYLMGVMKTPRGYAVWNLKVDLKPGQNAVTLDQNNAVTAV
jgi:hypothetical protein